jgi:5'-nucleotidase
MLILLDQDGVLADFEQGFHDAWVAQERPCPAILPIQRRSFYLRDDYPPHVNDLVQQIYTSPGFFRNLAPHAGALHGVKDMLSAGHDVRICTSPLSQYRNCVTEKYEWVEQHLGFDFVARMMVTKDKTLMHGDVLIDDRPEVVGSRTPTWQHWVMDQPYNRNSSRPRLSWANWSSVLSSLSVSGGVI